MKLPCPKCYGKDGGKGCTLCYGSGEDTVENQKDSLARIRKAITLLSKGSYYVDILLPVGDALGALKRARQTTKKGLKRAEARRTAFRKEFFHALQNRYQARRSA